MGEKDGHRDMYRMDAICPGRTGPEPVPNIELPRTIVIGEGAVDSVPDVLKKLNLSGNTYIVTGRRTNKAAGEKIAGMLEAGGRKCGTYISEKASPEEIEAITDTVFGGEPCCLLGVGSGRSIDLAKLASTKLGIPFLSIPTAASHDGIVSSRASIHSSRESKSVEAQPPMAVIADTALIAKAPYELLAAGCGDIISNHTSVLDWELASRLRNEPFNAVASSMALMSAELIMDSADLIHPGKTADPTPDAARLVVQALVTSGMAMSFAGSSRPASGAEHMFGHALDHITKKPALHGVQCAVGSIMTMYLHGGDWNRIRDTMIRLGIPTSAAEMGIPDEDIINALLAAPSIRPERYTILGKGLTRSAAEKAARITQVID